MTPPLAIDPGTSRTCARSTPNPADVAGILAGRMMADLRRIARRHLAHERRPGREDPGALISEAYLRLGRQRDLREENGAQFLALASTSMRRALVDEGRRRRARKRPQDGLRVEGVERGIAPRIEYTLPVREAIGHLRATHPRRAAIVRMRFFDGLSIEEIGACRALSPATVKRELRAALDALRSDLA